MKFVYFDVGGVLMKDLSDNDEGWQFLLFNKFGLKKNQLEEFDIFFETFEKDLDLGRGLKEFVTIMDSRFDVKLPKNYSLVDELVNNFFYKNDGLDDVVKKLKEKYKLGLLTNMYSGMLDLIREKNLIPKINWNVVVDSSVEEYRKPNKEIYEIAESKSGFKGNEILFIDNKKENLEIPKKMGWQTYWYDSSDYDKSNQELVKILR